MANNIAANKSSISNQKMQKLIKDAESKNESVLFYDEATMTESGPKDPINDYIYIKDKKALENAGVVFFDAATNTQMTYQKKGETDDDYIKLLSTSQRAKADSSPDHVPESELGYKTNEEKIKEMTNVHEGDRIQGVIDGLKSGKSDTELLTYLEGEFDGKPTLEKIKKELGYKTNEEKIKEMTDVHEGDRIEAVISLLQSGNYNRAELESHLTGEFPPGTLDKIINELNLDPNVLINKDLNDYDFKALSKDESDTYDFYEMSFLPSIEFDKIRNSKAFKLLKDNNEDTSELLGFEKHPNAGAIKLPNPHHDKFDEKSLMQMVSKDAGAIVEPLLDFIWETPKDVILSLGVAAVNGADVAVNLIPLIDKVFDYSGNTVGFQNLIDDKKVMEFAQNLDVKLDKTRDWIKKYKKDDNFVSQLIGIIGQDAIYSYPIFNKLRDLGMPKYPAFFISGGIGGAIGIEQKIFGQESTFLMHFYSKEIEGLKNVVGILPNTPYDEIADEVVQALEYGTMSAFIPAVVQSLQFMKKNIPFYAEKSIKKNKRKSKK